MLPLFKKTHISSRAILDFVQTGRITEYSDEPNKRNALRQAGVLYRAVDGELYRHGSDREYQKYGLRTVIHDDEPERKREIIETAHIDSVGHHLGMNTTIKNVSDTFYWQGISAHVKVYLKTCEMCKVRSKLDAEQWVETERQNLYKKSEKKISTDAKIELKNLGRIKKPTPPETFFIVNANTKVDFDTLRGNPEMLIDSNNIEFVIETLGHSEDGIDLDEVYHVLNVPDIVPVVDRCRSREIEAFLKHGTYPDDFTVNQRSGLRGPAAQYCIIEGELYHEGNKAGSKGVRLVIHDDKPALKVKLMVECHLDKDGSHNGLNKTMNKIGEKYFWIGMSIDVRKFLLSCRICNNGRGKRNIREDAQKYKHEVERLKQRQSLGTSQEDTITMYSQETGEQITTTSDAYNQIIQLVGPNEDSITEITVAVVDGEFVPQKIEEHQTNMDIDVEETGVADNIEVKSSVASTVTGYMQQSSSSAAASDEVTNAGAVTGKGLKQNKEMIVAGADGSEGRLTMAYEEQGESGVEAEVLRMILKQELVGDDSGEVTTKDEEANNRNNDAGVHAVGMSGDESSGRKVSGSHSGVENYDHASRSVEVDHLRGEDGHPVTILMKPIDTEMKNVTGFYKDVIYVPRLSKTRAIELYLKEKKVLPMYAGMKLKEIAQYYEYMDGMVFRRPSPYKARQILIHDDQPELKYSIIEEMHIKPTGGHNSELITGKNLTYKYFWDEVFWDIYRYFSRCPVCVEDGRNIKTGKPVLTMEEKRRQMREKRYRDSESQARAENRARDYRLQQTIKLARLRLQQRYTVADNMDTVLDEHAEFMDERDEMEEALEGTVVSNFKLEATSDDEVDDSDGMSADAAMVNMEVLPDDSCDESDIEINIPESDGDDSFIDDTVAVVDDTVAVVDDSMVAEDDSPAKLAPVSCDLDGVATQEQHDDSTAADDDDCNQDQHGESTADAVDTVATQNLDQHGDDDAGIEGVSVVEDFSSTNDAPEADEGSPGKDPQPRRSRRRAESTSHCLDDATTLSDGDVERKGKGPKRQIEKVSTPLEEASKSRRATKRPVSPPEVEVSRPRRETKRPVSQPEIMESRPRREVKRPRRFSPETVQKKSSSKMDTEQIKSEKTPKSEKLAVQSDGLKKTENTSLAGNRASPQKNNKKSISNEIPQTSSQKIVSTRSKVVKDTDSATSIPNLSNKSSLRQKTVTEATSVEQPDKEELETVHSDAAVDTEEEMAEVNEVKSVENQDEEEEEISLSSPIDVAPEHLDEFDNDTENSIEEVMVGDDDSADDLEDLDEDDDFDDTDEDDVGSNPALKVLLEDHSLEKIEAVKVSDGYTCSVCDQKFTAQKKCTDHCKVLACIDKCELCGKLFKKNQIVEFESHTSLHQSETDHHCKICKKGFLHADHLRVHERSHESDMSERCTLCEFTCFTSFQLASHTLQEHGEAHVFTCDICKAKFVNINFMKPQLCIDGQMSYFKCVMCRS